MLFIQLIFSFLLYYYFFLLKLKRFNPDIIAILTNLGSLYRSIGDLHAAKSTLQNGLSIMEKSLKLTGITNLNQIAMMNNLGLVYVDLGFYNQAELMYIQAIKMETSISNKDNLYNNGGHNKGNMHVAVEHNSILQLIQSNLHHLRNQKKIN